MKKLEITINGTSYPCKMTLGAMLRFKELTGKEVSEISQTEVSAMATLLYCCAASGASSEGKSLDLTPVQFCDNISAEDLNAWASAVAEAEVTPDAGDDAKKKQ